MFTATLFAIAKTQKQTICLQRVNNQANCGASIPQNTTYQLKKPVDKHNNLYGLQENYAV